MRKDITPRFPFKTMKTNYNNAMEQRKPELIFSTLTGIVMMIFMLASLANQELFRFEFTLGGSFYLVRITSVELVIPLTAVLTVLEMYRILKNNLPVSAEQIGLHLFLPFAVTLAIGFTLRNIRGGLTGWGLLLVNGALLYLVLRFEYDACDPASARRPVSIVVLDGLCYAVFLLFIVALRANVTPLMISLPSILLLTIVISLKVYSYHVIHGNIILLAVVTGLILSFSEVGLHYWPVNVVAYGSLMFFWYHTYTSFVIGADHGESYRSIAKRNIPVGLFSLMLLGYAFFRI